MGRRIAWDRSLSLAVAAGTLLAGCGGAEAGPPPTGPGSPGRDPAQPVAALRAAVAAGDAAVVHLIPPDAPRFAVGGAVRVAGGRWQARSGDGAWSRHALWRPIRHAALAGAGILAVDEGGRVWRFPALDAAPRLVGTLPPSSIALSRAAPPRGHRALVLPHREGAVVVDPDDGIGVVADPTLTVAVELEGRPRGDLVVRTVDGTVMRRRRGEPSYTVVGLGASALGLGLLEGRTVAFLAATGPDDGRPHPPFPRAVPKGGPEGAAVVVDLGSLGVEEDGPAGRTRAPPRQLPPPLGQRAWAHAVPVGDALLVLDPARRAPAVSVVDAATLTPRPRRLLLPAEDCEPPFPLGPGGAGMVCGNPGAATTLYRSDRLSAFEAVDPGGALLPATPAPAARPDGSAIAWVGRGCDEATREGPPRLCVASVDGTEDAPRSWPLDGDGTDPMATVGGWDTAGHVLGGSTLVHLESGGTRAVVPQEGWAFEETPRLARDGVVWATARAKPVEDPSRALLLAKTSEATEGPVTLSPWAGTLPAGWHDVAVLEEAMAVVTAPSGVWRTADGGGHWTALAPSENGPDAFPADLRLPRCDRRGCLALTSEGSGEPAGGVLVAGDPMGDVRSPPGPATVHVARRRSRGGAPDEATAAQAVERGAALPWSVRCEPSAERADDGAPVATVPPPGAPVATVPPPGAHTASTAVARDTWVTLAFAPAPTGTIRWDLHVRWQVGAASPPRGVRGRPSRVDDRLGTALGAGDWGALVHLGPMGGAGTLLRVREGRAPRTVPLPATLGGRPAAMGVAESGAPQLAFPTVDPSWGGSRRLDLARFDPEAGEVTVIRSLTLDAGTVVGRPWTAGAGGGLLLWDAAGRAHRLPPAGPPRRWPALDRDRLARIAPCRALEVPAGAVWRVVSDVVRADGIGDGAGEASGDLTVDALELRVAGNGASACLGAVEGRFRETSEDPPPAAWGRAPRLVASDDGEALVDGRRRCTLDTPWKPSFRPQHQTSPLRVRAQ